MFLLGNVYEASATSFYNFRLVQTITDRSHGKANFWLIKPADFQVVTISLMVVCDIEDLVNKMTDNCLYYA